MDSSVKTSVQCTPAAKGEMFCAFYFSGNLADEIMTGAGSGC